MAPDPATENCGGVFKLGMKKFYLRDKKWRWLRPVISECYIDNPISVEDGAYRLLVMLRVSFE